MNELEARLAEVMQADRFRLRRQWERIVKLSEGSPRKKVDLDRLHHALDQSVARRIEREQLNPSLQYDPDLPITAHRDQLIQLIQDRQAIVVCGETGSGKSTQLPKLCLEAGRGRSAMIGHTQPRRLAARTIANRLAEELETQVGQQVGFKIRFTDRTLPTTLIKLMTDGVLLAEIQRDRFLDSYDTIIIDEAHERSLNIDLLMGYIHQLLPRRPDLRLIITSATIDAEKFSEHFHDALGPAPIVSVSGRTYPVDVRYRGPDRAADDGSEAAWMNRFTLAVDELTLAGYGDILAFLPTERHIRDTAKHLRGHLTHHGVQDRLEILPLYSRLTEAEQQKIFQPHKQRRIVLATNVAESSLTVPGIRFVIDAGTARISRYAPRSKVQRLPIEPVSQASADQRAGRCGRLGPGICLRLYSQEDYDGRSRFTTPEIRRTNLASAILQSQILGVGNLELLPLLDPPRPEMIKDGLATLRELNAIDEEDKLTDLGRRLGRWPVDPRVGRMVIEADRNGCLADVLIIAAALEVQDTRIRPPEKQQAADAAHVKFNDPHSDFLSFLRIWDFYHRLKEDLGRNRLQRACNENFLSLPRIREWADVHRQLVAMVTEQGMKITARRASLGLVPADPHKSEESRSQNKTSHSASQAGSIPLPQGYEQIHLSLLAGLLSGIAMQDDQRKYKGAGGIDFQIWPGSGLKNVRPKWIMSAEIVETHARFGRTVAIIDPAWIEPLAKHMLKYSYDQPHFGEKAGAAMVHQRGTLFGLPVIQRRRVPLAPIDPEMARKLLIDDGLVERQLNSKAAFYQHNCQLLDEVHEWANRTRRRDLVVDPYFLAQHYEQHLPKDVVDRPSLEKFARTQSPVSQTQAATLASPLVPGSTPSENAKQPLSIWLTWDQVASSLDRDTIVEQFPSQLVIGKSKLPLVYRFSPGDELDGVSVVVPQVAVSQLQEDQLEWLVPGLLEEKILGLIKSLPKRLRRNLVPGPDAAAKATQQLLANGPPTTAFWPTVCACLSRLAEETIHPSDFQLDKLSSHHRMLISVVDESGNVAANSRDLAELRPQDDKSAFRVSPELAIAIEQFDWYRESMKTFDIVELPKSITASRSGIQVTLYPTLVEQQGSIRTQLVEREDLAEQLLQQNVLKMYTAIENRELKSQVNHLPQYQTSQIRLASRIGAELLRSDLCALMARIAFTEGGSSVRTQAEFEARRKNRLERISLAAQEIGRWLPRFSEQFHLVALHLEKAPVLWRSNVANIQQQLDTLLSTEFLRTTPWEWLKEFPRFLQAISARLERLKSIGSAKDLALLEPIDRFWLDYQKRVSQPSASPTNDAALAEYRWLIEELRVSVFAQQLGTRVAVSPKRLEKFAAKLVINH